MDVRPENLEVIDSHAHFMTRAFFEEFEERLQGVSLEKMEQGGRNSAGRLGKSPKRKKRIRIWLTNGWQRWISTALRKWFSSPWIAILQNLEKL